MIRGRLSAHIGAMAAIGALSLAERNPSDEKIDAERRAADRQQRTERVRVRSEQAAKADHSINRRTGQPHAHARAKARRLRQITQGLLT